MKSLSGLSSEGVNYVNKVISIVCDTYGISAEDIKSKSRKTGVIIARHIVHYFISTKNLKPKYPYVYYATRRDHACMFNSVDRVQNMIDTEPEFNNTVKTISKELNNDNPLHSKIIIDTKTNRVLMYVNGEKINMKDSVHLNQLASKWITEAKNINL